RSRASGVRPSERFGSSLQDPGILAAPGQARTTDQWWRGARVVVVVALLRCAPRGGTVVGRAVVGRIVVGCSVVGKAGVGGMGVGRMVVGGRGGGRGVGG